MNFFEEEFIIFLFYLCHFSLKPALSFSFVSFRLFPYSAGHKQSRTDRSINRIWTARAISRDSALHVMRFWAMEKRVTKVICTNMFYATSSRLHRSRECEGTSCRSMAAYHLEIALNLCTNLSNFNSMVPSLIAKGHFCNIYLRLLVTCNIL